MPRLLEQVRAVIRLKHYSLRTEEAYLRRIKEYILFHHKRHPNELSGEHVTQFLSHLVSTKMVAPSTQNQAASALIFLYREVLAQPLAWLDQVPKAKKPAKLPIVFTREDARSVIARLDGTKWLMASLL